MAGIDVIVVLAGATQLLDYSLKLTSSIAEIYSRVKHSPERVYRHTTQIYQLIETARFIQLQSKLHYQPLILTHVKSTLEEAGELQKILDRVLVDYTQGSHKKRVWKAVLGSQEKRLVTCFDRLEKEKSALLLCINFSQTETLNSLRDSVAEITRFLPSADTMSNRVPVVSEDSKGGNNSRAPLQEKQATENGVVALIKRKRTADPRSTPNESSSGTNVQEYQESVETNSGSNFLGGAAQTGVVNSQTYKGEVKTSGKSMCVGGNIGDEGSQTYEKKVTTNDRSTFVGGSVGKGGEEGIQNVFGTRP
ncbi:hypothetical protein G7Y89_g6487 [Cudoniella acicularis]|uniref:NACHT-NTPase and P-loop NTPases N-terminal domain-containing protein n=1 Tax=Cudoniella acicularis TaxID=354080 RepID=A0A8H4W2U2_9HELO|nr:hypothetical protein G7Y89_g6487 [Cudoniella acicularis]